MREPGVVNDLATADVDSVMQIAATRCDEMRAQRRFLVTGQEPIGTVYPGTGRDSLRISYGLELCEVTQVARKTGREKGVTVRDDDGEFVGLLHGRSPVCGAMGDERTGSTRSASLE